MGAICAVSEAGVDMMRELIAQDRGQKVAYAVAVMSVRSRRRTASLDQETVYPAAVATRHPDVAKAIAAMRTHIAFTSQPRGACRNPDGTYRFHCITPILESKPVSLLEDLPWS